jgi:catechol O-methyltransferase
MSEPDPFSCFGDDDDEDDDASEESPSLTPSECKATKNAVKRDPSCGILAFHAGTEQSLLKHVELEMTTQRNNTNADGAFESESDRADFVLHSIDEFSMKRHWMMHVGDEKGEIIKKFVQECCSTSLISNQHDRPLVFVELGSYCGYSSILLAKTLHEGGRKFHLYSVEVVEQHAQVAKKMVHLAGFEDQITILLLDPDPEKMSLTALLKGRVEKDVTIDFLFIDHDKSLYLSDLQQLEGSGLMKKGCFVAADNVTFAMIDDYREYTNHLARKGHVKTRLEESWLEYSQPDWDGDASRKNLMRDGIGRFIEADYASDFLSVLIF